MHIAGSERVAPSVPWIVGGRPDLPVRCVLSTAGSRRRSSGAGLTTTDRRARRVANWRSGQADHWAWGWAGSFRRAAAAGARALLGLGDDLFDVAGGSGGGEGFGAEVVHDMQVVVQVRRRLQVEGAGEG